MKTLEYVISGTSYMRLTNPSVSRDPINSAIVSNLFDVILKNKNSHTTSLLYNAFTESGFGSRFDPYKNNIKNIHADSGGLQMITLGKTITDELKDKVYENQAKYSDVGMCFDEIPIVIANTSGKSDRNAVNDRYFDSVNFETYARQTGKNIKRQLEVFENHNSKCKPFVILQGNCYDTYMQWYDYVMDEIPSSEYSRLGGIALGGAALGTGPLEDVQRAFIASQIPWHEEKMHLHILGVGSIRRLLPYLIFVQNGMYDRMQISYDSTTHSRAVETGLYYIDNYTLKYSRKKDNLYRTIYDDISRHIQLGIDLDTFYDILNQSSTKWKDQGLDFSKWIEVRTALCLCSIHNFMAQAEKMMLNNSEILDYTNTLGLETQYRNLYNIKNVEDFKYWFNNPYLGGMMKTSAVATEASATLEDCFN
jgi:hypothetical protein